MWQRGPDFLKLPESEWPITRVYSDQPPAKNIKASTALTVATNTPKDTLAFRININKYSGYQRLTWVTARILAMYNRTPKATLKNATKTLTPDDIAKAEQFWILNAQESIQDDIKQGKYKRLCPRRRKDGIYIVGNRTERWTEMSSDKAGVILLPYKHRFSRLYAELLHRRGHSGVNTHKYAQYSG